MGNAGNNIRKVLHKRLEAMAKHNARKVEFFKTRDRIIQDIEETRDILRKTMELLPKHEF
jgi:hypothetical protein